MDIWGLFSCPSTSGHRYFLTVIDDKSRNTWIFLMKHKHETRNLAQSFVQMAETQFNARVECIRTDNGSEFMMKRLFCLNRIYPAVELCRD